MRIAIIGSGIVGQATGMGFAANGNEVIFYDIKEAKLLTVTSKGYSTAANLDYAVRFVDVVFVGVPTPTVGGRLITVA